ncbi:Uma2 family endonuclease [Nostocaceae cyanobacterium CENA369]|uniref:Uma2 family endonuclease n=1 Tax=Dendronalium phyllosphericum CENA369 TaxID=1725256 RepID=A0A8J7I3H9_9NOST|nr:Uma2 family endonuclease [Dendronalium phyllosphericum]MBH8575324.1 Uma2 family endonuclease [Dendronalium phyllosphericum CENA369]
MKTSPQHNYLTPEEYLQLEEQNSVKHEYIDGYIYAMAEVLDPYVTIAGNLAVLLRDRVRGTGCRVYIADMKARIESLNRFYYPDVMVTCDPRDRETPAYKRFPCLIVEVLSDSTEAFDRGDKFADYQALESLQEYTLINTKRQRVECFRRNDEGLWILQSYTSENQSFRLNSVDFQETIVSLYEDVVFA